jgi:hypothetical protein
MLVSLVKIPIPGLSSGEEFMKIVILEYFLLSSLCCFKNHYYCRRFPSVFTFTKTISPWPRCKWGQIIGFILMKFYIVICWPLFKIWLLLVKESFSVTLYKCIILSSLQWKSPCHISIYVTWLIFPEWIFPLWSINILKSYITKTMNSSPIYGLFIFSLVTQNLSVCVCVCVCVGIWAFDCWD